jgi:hypothetical protein
MPQATTEYKNVKAKRPVDDVVILFRRRCFYKMMPEQMLIHYTMLHDDLYATNYLPVPFFLEPVVLYIMTSFETSYNTVSNAL